MLISSPTPKFICRSSNPQCDDIWRSGLWEVIRDEWEHEGGSCSHNGINVLARKDTRELALILSLPLCSPCEGTAGMWPHHSLTILAPDLTLLASRSWENNFLLFKLLVNSILLWQPKLTNTGVYGVLGMVSLTKKMCHNISHPKCISFRTVCFSKGKHRRREEKHWYFTTYCLSS